MLCAYGLASLPTLSSRETRRSIAAIPCSDAGVGLTEPARGRIVCHHMQYP